MEVVNIHDAKTHLSQLLQRVEAGEEVIIGRAGHPIARLVPYEAVTRNRVPGALRGKIRIHEDFDELPLDLLAAFNGEEP